jgi:hypothetical protein
LRAKTRDRSLAAALLQVAYREIHITERPGLQQTGYGAPPSWHDLRGRRLARAFRPCAPVVRGA